METEPHFDSLKDYIRHELAIAPDSTRLWTVDSDPKVVRHAIGRAFAGTDIVDGEPTFKWAMNHFGGTTSTDEVEHLIRFFTSFAFLQDLRKRRKDFHLCSISSSSKDIVSFATVQEYDCQVQEAKWFGKLRRKLSGVLDFFILYIVYEERIPSLMMDSSRSQDVQRLEKKISDFDERSIQWHKEVVPNELHWYVHMVGVTPELQGQGNGKILMEKLNQLADRNNRLMYLEAGGPNRIFYEKLGFRVQKTVTFVDPEDSTDSFDLHLMTRLPQTHILR